MNELAEVVEAAVCAGERDAAAVLATVVKVTGSAYRGPGARMFIPQQGDPVGLVSGGCLESDLIERAREVAASGEPRIVVYDTRSPDDIVWGLGLGCNGEVKLLLERLRPPLGYLELLGGCLRRRRRCAVCTVFAGEGRLRSAIGERVALSEDEERAISVRDDALATQLEGDARAALGSRCSALRRHELPGGAAEVLVEYVPAALSLLVVGAGGDARPLVELAKRLGFRVTVVDDRPALATPERFPEADEVRQVRFEDFDPQALGVDAATAVVLMTHHFLHDLAALERLVSTDAPYLGLLGPRRRTERLIDELARGGRHRVAEVRARLYGPLGLDIGAETPAAIALAAVAEIHAVLWRRGGGFLRERRTPLHEWTR